MRNLTHISRAEVQSLRGLLFDLDETLLDRGRLTQAAYGALFDLRRSGLQLFMVTGRPARWGRVLLPQWALDGATLENGGISLSPGDPCMQWHDPLSPAQRSHRRQLLSRIISETQSRFPEAQLSDDSEDRITDCAIDIGEHQQLDSGTVGEIRSFIEAQGAKTTHSSIHLHATLDDENKASGVLKLLRATQGITEDAARNGYAYIGDSFNDAPCFAVFETSIAVSNFNEQLPVMPRWVTTEARGKGFAEAARAIVELR